MSGCCSKLLPFFCIENLAADYIIPFSWLLWNFCCTAKHACSRKNKINRHWTLQSASTLRRGYICLTCLWWRACGLQFPCSERRESATRALSLHESDRMRLTQTRDPASNLYQSDSVFVSLVLYFMLACTSKKWSLPNFYSARFQNPALFQIPAELHAVHIAIQKQFWSCPCVLEIEGVSGRQSDGWEGGSTRRPLQASSYQTDAETDWDGLQRLLYPE